MPANDRIKAGAHFAVGGVTQTLSAWLDGDVRLEPDQLVEQLASLLDQLTDPAVYGLTETTADPKAASRDPSSTNASS